MICHDFFTFCCTCFDPFVSKCLFNKISSKYSPYYVDHVSEMITLSIEVVSAGKDSDHQSHVCFLFSVLAYDVTACDTPLVIIYPGNKSVMVID